MDAELWMKEPEEKRLNRLVEHPALMARGCDTGEFIEFQPMAAADFLQLIKLLEEAKLIKITRGSF